MYRLLYRKIILYRNTLLRDVKVLQQEIDRYGANQSWQRRISNGSQACVEAATDMIKLLGSLEDADTINYTSITSSPLAAAYVLVIYICREPSALLSQTYFEVSNL